MATLGVCTTIGMCFEMDKQPKAICWISPASVQSPFLLARGKFEPIYLLLSTVACAASRSARIAGAVDFGGKTFHEPSSCRKKTIARVP
jgi:hypothetical protein